MKIVWAASAALVLVCACTTKPEPASGVATAAAVKEKKVCKSQTILGQMTPVQICHTKEEWAALRNRQAEGVKDADRSTRAIAGTTSTSN